MVPQDALAGDDGHDDPAGKADLAQDAQMLVIARGGGEHLVGQLRIELRAAAAEHRRPSRGRQQMAG